VSSSELEIARLRKQLQRTQGWLEEFTGQAAADHLRLVFVQAMLEKIIANLTTNGQTFAIETLQAVLKPIKVKPEPLANKIETYRQQLAQQEQELDTLRGRIFELERYVERLEKAEAQHVAHKHQAYRERNRLVAFLAKCYPAGLAVTKIEGWDAEWHGCVYVDTPAGQMSWHVHDSELQQFNFLGAYTKPWDRHTTEEKYDRLTRLDPDVVWPEHVPRPDGPG